MKRSKNPFICGKEGCNLCNEKYPFTQKAVQHALENGVKNDVLIKEWDKKNFVWLYKENPKNPPPKAKGEVKLWRIIWLN